MARKSNSMPIDDMRHWIDVLGNTHIDKALHFINNHTRVTNQDHPLHFEGLQVSGLSHDQMRDVLKTGVPHGILNDLINEKAGKPLPEINGWWPERDGSLRVDDPPEIVIDNEDLDDPEEETQEDQEQADPAIDDPKELRVVEIKKIVAKGGQENGGSSFPWKRVIFFIWLGCVIFACILLPAFFMLGQ